MKMIKAERKDDEGFWLILCPKDEKEVPVYQCAGSFVKGEPICDHVLVAVIGGFSTEVECLWPEKREVL